MSSILSNHRTGNICDHGHIINGESFRTNTENTQSCSDNDAEKLGPEACDASDCSCLPVTSSYSALGIQNRPFLPKSTRGFITELGLRPYRELAFMTVSSSRASFLLARMRLR